MQIFFGHGFEGTGDHDDMITIKTGTHNHMAVSFMPPFVFEWNIKHDPLREKAVGVFTAAAPKALNAREVSSSTGSALKGGGCLHGGRA